eukprot:jgi/Mesen1/5361/ME000267S04507
MGSSFNHSSSAREGAQSDFLTRLRSGLDHQFAGLQLAYWGGKDILQVPWNRMIQVVVQRSQKVFQGNRLTGGEAKRLGVSEKDGTLAVAGKVCIVTGGNAGVGLATATELAARGAHVIVACRSAERARAAVDTIMSSPAVKLSGLDGWVESMTLDLASLDSVRDFAQSFSKRNLGLDVLVNNAGIMAPPTRLVTRDGFEMQWQVNYLGHFLLTQQLLQGRAKKAGPSVDREFRVVNVTSMTHHGGRIHFDDINFSRNYQPLTAYAQSKFAIVLGTNELQRRHPELVAVSVHPGLVDTDLARGFFLSKCPKMLHFLLTPLFPHILRTCTEVVDNMMFAITAPAAEVSGKYVADNRVSNSSKLARDKDLALQLWTLSEFHIASN